MARRSIRFLIVVTVLCAAGEWHGRARSAEPAAVYFGIDYVPHIVYEDDPATICFRVENTGTREVPVKLAVRQLGIGGLARVLPLQENVLKPGERWLGQVTAAPGSSKDAASEVELVLQRGKQIVGRHNVVFLGTDEDEPVVHARGPHLYDGNGKLAVFRIEHRARKPDRRWILPRLIYKRITGGKIKARTVGLLTDLSGGEQRWQKEAAGTLTCYQVPQRRADITYPILASVETAGGTILKNPPDFAVLFLGNTDAAYGTDPVLFRKGVELIIQLLGERGCRNVLLIEPVSAEADRKSTSRLCSVVKKVAWVYRMPSTAIGHVLSEADWAATGSAPIAQTGKTKVRELPVFMSHPNDAGQKKIVRAICQHINRLCDRGGAD